MPWYAPTISSFAVYPVHSCLFVCVRKSHLFWRRLVWCTYSKWGGSGPVDTVVNHGIYSLESNFFFNSILMRWETWWTNCTSGLIGSGCPCSLALMTLVDNMNEHSTDHSVKKEKVLKPIHCVVYVHCYFKSVIKSFLLVWAVVSAADTHSSMLPKNNTNTFVVFVLLSRYRAWCCTSVHEAAVWVKFMSCLLTTLICFSALMQKAVKIQHGIKQDAIYMLTEQHYSFLRGALWDFHLFVRGGQEALSLWVEISDKSVRHSHCQYKHRGWIHFNVFYYRGTIADIRRLGLLKRWSAFLKEERSHHGVVSN